MKKIYSDIIQYRGSHYQFGFMQGEQLKDSLIIKNREQQWKVRKPRFVINETEAKLAIEAIAPKIWEELTGLMDALKWPMERVLTEFGGYRQNYIKSGCSIVTGSNFFIRNYDYHPKTYEGRYVFYQPTDGGYATVGPSQRITGRSDGMNEKGLVMGYNFMHRKKPGVGFICGMIGRLLLEYCKDVQEAVSMLEEIPHRHSFSYIVYDTSRQTLVVEASPRGIEVREANICTNHFEKMKQENRNYLKDSYRRMEIIQQEKVTTAREAFRLFNDSDKGVFSDEYHNWAGTIHTSAYFPEDRKAWIALGGDQEPVVFDFANWIGGTNINQAKIVGEVNTDIAFLHMDKNATWFRKK